MSAKVNIAVIGLGRWGPNIVRSLQADGRARVVLGVDPSEAQRELMAEHIPELQVTDNLDECLGNPDIHAVAIVTPTETHHQLGMQALTAGKHVLMEKPLAFTSAGAQELMDFAAEKERILMTGHVFLYNLGVRKMKELVDQGELGQLLYMRSVRSNLGPLRTDVNALWDLAAHDISIFNYIFDSKPLSVSCTAFSPLGLRQEDIAQGSLKYPGDRAATFFVSWLDPQKRREITVVGDQKMLLFDDMVPTKPLTLYDKGIKMEKRSPYSDSFHTFRMSIHQGQVTDLDTTTGEPLKEECRHFVDCVVNEQTPLSDAQNGLDVVRILEGLTKSYNSNGESISLWS